MRSSNVGVVEHAVEMVQTLERRQLCPGRVELVRHTPVDFVPHMFHVVAMIRNVNSLTLSHCVYASITTWFS